MFTGIIEEIGEVKFRRQKSNSLILGIQGEKIAIGTKIGDSIAVDGVCLTVTNIKNKILYFDVMAETLRVSTLGDIRIGKRINLECALKVEDRLGGHFVTGHIDGIGRIVEIIPRGAGSKEVKIATPPDGGSQRLRRIAVSADFTQYIAPKGSIAVDGISLTVVKAEKDYFTTSLIPYTLKHTTIGIKKEGDRVNIELDILAKYVAELQTKEEKNGDYLKELLKVKNNNR